MNKQWIYRNGDKPFSVTEIELPDGEFYLVSIAIDCVARNHYVSGNVRRTFDSSGFDLIPYEPYSDYVINDEVNCWNDDDGDILSGHFAGLTTDGKPTIFHNGGTSFTRHPTQRSSWNFCEKAFCEKANKEDK
jgi:hypothetical protein